MNLVSYAAVAAAAYLLGSFPSGVVLARLRGNVDILNQGSKKTGATNVLRTMGWKAAAPVFAMDFVKGMLAVAAARLITGGDPSADVIAGLAALLGHNYSLFIRFRGGRGVTTGLGAVAIISPVAMLITLAVALLIVARTRYVSLGSVVGAGLVPFSLLALVIAAGQPFPHLMFGLLGGAFVIVSHKDNINRLLHGTERKLGERA
jgi:acyl phosphate:glycerol-3-phosphate acyltransferase